MSLLAPTRGELLDRLSILTLKVAHSTGEAQRWWLEEMRQIGEVLGLTIAEAQELPVFQDLCRVNAQIWRANEELARRTFRIIAPPDYSGLEMFRWNQERVALIELIDKAAGQFVQHTKVGY